MQEDTTVEVDDVESSAESADAAEPCAESAGAESNDRLEELVLRSTKLDACEAAELRAMFPNIERTHQKTFKASVLLKGLTPLTIYYFRFRALTRTGAVDFSQVVSLSVL